MEGFVLQLAQQERKREDSTVSKIMPSRSTGHAPVERGMHSGFQRQPKSIVHSGFERQNAIRD